MRNHRNQPCTHTLTAFGLRVILSKEGVQRLRILLLSASKDECTTAWFYTDKGLDLYLYYLYLSPLVLKHKGHMHISEGFDKTFFIGGF